MPNGEETTFDSSANSLARYAVFDTNLRDTNSIGHGAKPVQLSGLRLIPRRELTDGWIGLPLTRVQTIRADGSIELDESLIPPVLYPATAQAGCSNRGSARSMNSRGCGPMRSPRD